MDKNATEYGLESEAEMERSRKQKNPFKSKCNRQFSIQSKAPRTSWDQLW